MQKIIRNQMRSIKFTPNVNPYAQGSLLAEFGQTKVLITAGLESSVPSWLKNSGKGWVTAEYNMLPFATHERNRRERSKVSGRTQEIQRLIGRSLRSVVDLEKLGERSLIVDCDVLVADGGTRTTAISGGFVALSLAIESLLKSGELSQNPIKQALAALSVGITSSGEIIADLNYEEDSSCETDMNFVITESNEFVEIQGPAEGKTFSRDEFNLMTDCALHAVKDIFKAQREILKR